MNDDMQAVAANKQITQHEEEILGDFGRRNKFCFNKYYKYSQIFFSFL